jgi:ClpP class serine protease
MIGSSSFDRYVLPLLGSGYLMCDKEFALMQLSAYLQDVSLLQAGAVYSDLGISKRRSEQRPAITVFNDDLSFSDSETNPSSSKNGIATIKLSGVMREMGSASTLGAEDIRDQLFSFYENENIKAIVMDINSGGGESGAGFMLNAAIAERTKPVIARVTYAGSAAYMTAIACDEIHAAFAAAKIGGIGAFAQIDNEMIKTLQERFSFIYSDESDRKNEAFRGLLEGDQSKIKAEINAIGKQFRDMVSTSRALTTSVSDTLSGAMFDAKTAKKRGLIDAISTQQELMNRAAYLGMTRKKSKKYA